MSVNENPSVCSKITSIIFNPMDILININYTLWIIYSYNHNIFPLYMLIIISSLSGVGCIINYGTVNNEDVVGMILIDRNYKYKILMSIIWILILIKLVIIYCMIIYIENDKKLPSIILLIIITVFEFVLKYHIVSIRIDYNKNHVQLL